MTRTTVLLALAFLLCSACFAQNFTDVRPSPQQVEWQDLEIGVLIHFGPNTFMDREWGDGAADPKVFSPTDFNADQWMRAAKAAGARYAIMVAKHHDGFCLWPSGQTEYSVKSSAWRAGKGDVVREVERAARANGMKFGVYLSPWDRHDPRYKDNAAYDKYYVRQLEELATRYGELTEFWLDGAGSEGHVYDFDRYVDTLRTYQPNTQIFADVGFLKYGDARWVGNESGVANEENWNVVDRRGYLRWRPAEADTPLRDQQWFWHPNSEKRLKSLAKLLEIYHATVGRGAQLVLGLAPDNRGLLPESDVARLEEFGAALQRIYGNNLARKAHISTTPTEAPDSEGGAFTAGAEESRTLTVELQWEEAVSFDRVVLSERIGEGQHIRKFVIEANKNGAWQRLAAGSTVGHKRIVIFPRTTAKHIWVRLDSEGAEPKLGQIGVYDGR